MKYLISLLAVLSLIGLFPLNAFSACHSEFLCDNRGNCGWVDICDSTFDIPTPSIDAPRIPPIVPPETPSIASIGPPGLSGAGHHLYNPDKGEWNWYFENE